jgi:hypothetical protein
MFLMTSAATFSGKCPAEVSAHRCDLLSILGEESHGRIPPLLEFLVPFGLDVCVPRLELVHQIAAALSFD